MESIVPESVLLATAGDSLLQLLVGVRSGAVHQHQIRHQRSGVAPAAVTLVTSGKPAGNTPTKILPVRSGLHLILGTEAVVCRTLTGDHAAGL